MTFLRPMLHVLHAALCIAYLPTTPTFVVRPPLAPRPVQQQRTPAMAVPAASVAALRDLGAARRSRAARMASVNSNPAELLDPEKWTEAGVKALQRIPPTCQRLSQRVAEVEHLALALLEDDKGMASRVLLAAGASPTSIRNAFEAYALRQPKVYGSSDNGGNLVIGGSLASLLPKMEAQRTLLTDEYLAAEHALLALLNDERCGSAVMGKGGAALETMTLRAAIDQVHGHRPLGAACMQVLSTAPSPPHRYVATGALRRARPRDRTRRSPSTLAT